MIGLNCFACFCWACAGIENSRWEGELCGLPWVVGQREAQTSPERPPDHRTVSVVRVAVVCGRRHDGVDCTAAGEWRTLGVLQQTWVMAFVYATHRFCNALRRSAEVHVQTWFARIGVSWEYQAYSVQLQAHAVCYAWSKCMQRGSIDLEAETCVYASCFFI